MLRNSPLPIQPRPSPPPTALSYPPPASLPQLQPPAPVLSAHNLPRLATQPPSTPLIT